MTETIEKISYDQIPVINEVMKNQEVALRAESPEQTLPFTALMDLAAELDGLENTEYAKEQDKLYAIDSPIYLVEKGKVGERKGSPVRKED